MRAQSLTARQKQILDFVRRYIGKHSVPPSMQEIADGIGVQSLATIHKHLAALRDKGWIDTTYNKARSIRLGDVCQHCGRGA